MIIHHLRSATFVIEKDNDFILIDPMLGKKGSIPPFAFFRHKIRRNPYVELPANSTEILNKVTHALITHLHPDHLDDAGYKFLKEKNIPVICSKLDEKKLLKKGLNITQKLNYWEPQEFLGGKITGTPAVHGYGFIAKLMGNVMGFNIQFKDNSSIFISSDTIYTKDMDKVFKDLNPKLSVLAAGSAQFDFGGPLLMKPDDLIKFIKNFPNKVYANHMDAVNHCPTTRIKLKELLEKHGLTDKAFIPNDGESFEFISV
ncbi:MAG: MBL fold metallo-hydrolase [Bacteroidota bacterium]